MIPTNCIAGRLVSRRTILCLMLLAGSSCLAQTSSSKAAAASQEEVTRTMHAKGPFDVKLAPQDFP